MQTTTFLLVLTLVCLSQLLHAQEDGAAVEKRHREIADKLNYRKGEIVLRSGLAKVKVPEDFRYLDEKDTETVLTTIWGNPRGNSTLGMLVPATISPAAAESWGVIITYDEDGYVKDGEAAKLNYDELLNEMKKGTAAANKERRKEGYPGIELVGWAASPRYDAETHKMYWAKELKFDGSEENTLNYNIRVLGRRGVLVLNAVAGMSQLKDMEAVAPAILTMVDFQEGHRYADFNPATDKIASYGLAALVAGGLAGKAGLFKGLLAAVLAAKKFVIVGVIALVTFVAKLFGRKQST